MLEQFNFYQHTTQTLRLASLPRNNPNSTLLRRGVRPENLFPSSSTIARLGEVFSVEQVVEDSFVEKPNRTKPFPVGRFSDGSLPVYYSALEEATCQQELAYNLAREFSGEPGDTSGHPRSFSLISCFYSGTTSDLRGREQAHPELISQTEEGYPFCQSLGFESVRLKIDAFLAPSARFHSGTCIPVFNRSALSNPAISARFKVLVDDGDVEFQKEPFQ